MNSLLRGLRTLLSYLSGKTMVNPQRKQSGDRVHQRQRESSKVEAALQVPVPPERASLPGVVETLLEPVT